MRPLRRPRPSKFVDPAFEAVDDKTPGSLLFHGTCHAESDKLPNLNEEIEQRCPKILIVEMGVFEFLLKMPAWLFTVRQIRTFVFEILFNTATLIAPSFIMIKQG